MSFILDALKKSDAERQKRSTPGVADIPLARERRSPPRWLWVFGGLLAINLVALVVLLVRPEAPPPSDSGPLTVDVTPAAGENDTPDRKAFAEVVAEARRKAESSDAPAVRREPVPAARSERASATGERPAANVDGARREASAVPANTLESLRANGTVDLPDLHLDIHVYSEQPGERFVFINTKKYRENETLAEGPVVRRIAPEGVILQHRGTEFLLPRE